jgi:deoxyuridine 5''-triphosphate nucleotidohydrolase (dut)
MDLQAALEQDIVIQPGDRVLIPTGYVIALPEGYEAQVRPRSGLANRFGLTVANAPGTIDCDYRGEMLVLLINLGDAPVTVHRGDRIAQLVIAPVLKASWQLFDDLPGSTRNNGGFGSTGR